MRRTILLPCLAALALVARATLALAQGATDVPEPKMPPMPSMEGQQGDVSKPVTQIPARKKPSATVVKPAAKARSVKIRQRVGKGRAARVIRRKR